MIASFGSISFEVSSKKIMTPSDIEFSEKLNYEGQERAGDKPAIYVKGLGALETSVSVNLLGRYVDVEQEISYWFTKLRTAIPEKLTLGNHAWGNGKALLTEVSVSSVQILGSGIYAGAVVQLSFIEYAADGKSEKGAASTEGATMKAARIKLNETLVKP